MARKKWKDPSPAEKALAKKQTAMCARDIGTKVIFTDRELSITQCEAEDVTASEIKSFSLRALRAGLPLETIGKVRMYYDHRIDDVEKHVRLALGMESDYRHRFTRCQMANRRPSGYIDGVPMNLSTVSFRSYPARYAETFPLWDAVTLPSATISLAVSSITS